MNSNDHEHDEGRNWGRGAWIKIPFVVAAIILIKAGLILFLWNELIPDLFHGPTLTLLQAIELTILAKLLVSGGGKHWGGPRGGRHWGGRFGKFRGRGRLQNPEGDR